MTFRDARRWRRVFKTMNGFGEWLQLSVFQCRLSRRRRAELETRLREIVKPGEGPRLDLIDIGPADKTALVVESLGKTFAGIERRAVVWYNDGVGRGFPVNCEFTREALARRLCRSVSRGAVMGVLTSSLSISIKVLISFCSFTL